MKTVRLSDLSPEQKEAIKAGIKEQLEVALNSRGVKNDRGVVIPKYAFLKKKHIKKVKYIKSYTLEDGRRVYVRVFK